MKRGASKLGGEAGGIGTKTVFLRAAISYLGNIFICSKNVRCAFCRIAGEQRGEDCKEEEKERRAFLSLKIDDIFAPHIYIYINMLVCAKRARISMKQIPILRR